MLVLCICSRLVIHAICKQLLNYSLASCCAGLRSRQISGAPASVAAADQGMPIESECSDDAMCAADRRDAIKDGAAAEDRAFYKAMSGKNSGQSLQ